MQAVVCKFHIDSYTENRLGISEKNHDSIRMMYYLEETC